MQPMLRNEVMPRLQALSDEPLDHPMQVLRFTGISESDFHAQLGSPFAKIAHLEVGYCAHPGEVDLRLIGAEDSIEQAA